MEFEAVIGLEVHAELQTRTKMFCACPVVDSTQALPNISVCPVCAGMPGVLPVVNRQAVEYGIRVALALDCKVAHTSIFARKNYFYPDLPKGYQISQFEYPLAEHGVLMVQSNGGERPIRIRRVHLEEDAGKLTHVTRDNESYSLVDLNRAGVALLEIVSEPDMHTVEEVRSYGENLRQIVRYVGVNSGDMEKGVMRFEANISVRPVGSQELFNRTEVKNLNSFRALERSVIYEIERQSELYRHGQTVAQETLGWDESRGVTFSQRSKEEANDYRYFPEPDLPPLVVEKEWVDQVRSALPELPQARLARFQDEYGLSRYDSLLLVEEKAVGDYFEEAVKAPAGVPAKVIANWMLGDFFALMKGSGRTIETVMVSPRALADLAKQVVDGRINNTTAKTVLVEMFETGREPGVIIAARGLEQISDGSFIADLVREALEANPQELASYLAGKETLSQWFFGQVMRKAKGKANPQVVKDELQRQLDELKAK
jgi:aspartyl-tRNA(Asn)/glutamyl-tRNA(Gln) amidotransferase subunit B